MHDSESGLRINAGPNINLFIRGLVSSDICAVHPSETKLAVLFSAGYKCHISISYLSWFIQYVVVVCFVFVFVFLFCFCFCFLGFFSELIHWLNRRTAMRDKYLCVYKTTPGPTREDLCIVRHVLTPGRLFLLTVRKRWFWCSSIFI